MPEPSSEPSTWSARRWLGVWVLACIGGAALSWLLGFLMGGPVQGVEAHAVLGVVVATGTVIGIRFGAKQGRRRRGGPGR
jgi:hypothetical protein